MHRNYLGQTQHIDHFGALASVHGHGQSEGQPCACRQPGTAEVQDPGIDRLELLDQALEAVRNFEPLSLAEAVELLSRTAPAAAGGKYETFKTDQVFDSTAKFPQWLG